MNFNRLGPRGFKERVIQVFGGYTAREVRPILDLLEVSQAETNELGLPAEAALGLKLDGGGRDMAVVSPSPLMKRSGSPQVLVSFSSPGYPFGDIFSRTDTANFYFVPSRIDRGTFRKHYEFLQRFMPEGDRANAYAAILQLLRGYVLPEEGSEGLANPLKTWQLIMGVPYARWEVDKKGMTLGGTPLTGSAYAEAVVMATRDYPYRSLRLGGSAKHLMADAAPQQISFAGNEVAHSGKTWAYWRVKPKMDPISVRALLELDVRYVLFTRWLGEVIQAEMLVAASSFSPIGSDRASQRWNYLEYQLATHCDHAQRIEGGDTCAKAFWATVPGSPASWFGEPWEVTEPVGLMEAWTQTLTPPLSGGVFPFGKLRGIPYMYDFDYMPHCFAFGPQRRGKSTWLGISAYANTPLVLNVSFQHASGESGPYLSYLLGQRSAKDHPENEFQEKVKVGDREELVWKTGAHLLVNQKKQERVLVVHFSRPDVKLTGDTDGDDEKLADAYTEVIEDSVPEVLETTWATFAEGFPFSILPLAVRPSPACDLTLYAAFIQALIKKVSAEWSNYLIGIKGEWKGKAHLVYLLDDLSMVIGKKGDNSKSVQVGNQLLNTIHDLLAFGAKMFMHVFANSQAVEDLERFESGTRGYFPYVFEVTVEDVNGTVKRRYARIFKTTQDSQGQLVFQEEVDLTIPDEMVNVFCRQEPR